MISKVLKKLFGSRNDRLLKTYQKNVRLINQFEPDLEQLSDEALKSKTSEFKERLASGETLDNVLVEAFAVVREASKRVLQMRHFDAQLLGGMALHEGKISEMRTGEGKTLVATLPAYLNALSGSSVHVITVNDYLANRDAQWMGKVFEFLGMTVGVNLSGQDHDQKQSAYGADITYGTNNEFGFDYLRDNMVFQKADKVQRDLTFAIVDEVDSILIDEARTPLIISGQADDNTELYKKINSIASKLKRSETEEGDGDFTVDEKSQQVVLTEIGYENAEQFLSAGGLLTDEGSLYDPSNISLIHHVYAALRAHNLFNKDQHYVVQNQEIVIVDEFTGRLMSGRRWSDGLHQAVEAKEGLNIQKENQTLASITFQNYFRMYEKLSGMTGTADTEAFEFQQIYGLETVIIPTHRDMIRDDKMDQIYKTSKERYDAVLNDIKDCYTRGQPVLVGTTSIENSELISSLLDKARLPHQVLNAKQHHREAEIVAQAGRPKAITIATNMAGRGTDIVLGGMPADSDEDGEWQKRHDAVLDLGGLHIIGTERHESRRIDNQLRGRSGRQGDPGSTRFYLSLEDSLLRIFASDRVAAIMERLKLPEGEPIEHPWVTKAIENAQRKVEARNFDIRKQLLEFDDVANEQRKVIYEQRNDLLDSIDTVDMVAGMRDGSIEDLVDSFVPQGALEEQWDVPGLEKALRADYTLEVDLSELMEEAAELEPQNIVDEIKDKAQKFYEEKMVDAPGDAVQQYERSVMLQSIDSHWREHLAALDHLRQGIHLRGYAQKNPKQEYKREAFELFSLLLQTVRNEVTKLLMSVRIRSAEEVENISREQPNVSAVAYNHGSAQEVRQPNDGGPKVKADTFVRSQKKLGRNEPCWCESGKKYKHCHGRLG
ncbi:MAG: preprotein translocase subunit SecA [Proteobacteria bacterium]|nr:preprotein translocase subunit SecA [Pseudomonadota bacterium]MDA0861336.1 preprotein translocase subunit SecA [Pseudomonadota bacterium]MDA1031099.1 preprotein translocase subunit SecA [Pseudomonadota bacterium]